MSDWNEVRPDIQDAVYELENTVEDSACSYERGYGSHEKELWAARARLAALLLPLLRDAERRSAALERVLPTKEAVDAARKGEA